MSTKLGRLACNVAAILCVAARVTTLDAQAQPDIRDRLTVPDSAHLQIMTLADGSKVYGRIISVASDTVTFQTQAGSMQVAASHIREIKEIPLVQSRGGEYWFPNPNATRLFFAPTGQMLKKGEGYFSDYELFFPGVAYGVTDNVTIGGGFSLFPAAADEQVYYLTPKIGFSASDRVHLATGVLFAGTKGGTGGIYYGVATFGDSDGSVTVGGGYGFAGGKIESKPVGMIGGELRLAERVGIVSENYLLPISENNLLYSFGFRFLGEKLTTDLALVNVSGSHIIGVPYVDFVFKF
ncbi:MAG TPA: hypothetical protein VJ840_00150 [Gemmatimonadaceae bacterium]|nr:hypothetical protein [Gemmatimonadaceae bacterium]